MSPVTCVGASIDLSVDGELVYTGGLGMNKTLKNETGLIELRKELKQLAEDFYVVYKEFVNAGFNEEQALALTVVFMREEE